jgi:hypothetical protein
VSSSFQTISFDQAANLVRRHASGGATLVTPAVPGVSFQLSGQLYVQEGADQFAFAIAAGEHVSASVLLFAHCVFQVPEGEGAVDALLCALPASEGEGDALVWMLRFE